MHRAVENVHVQPLPNGEKQRNGEYGSVCVYRWILPPAKQHISDSTVKGALIWANEPRMSLVCIPDMFSIALPLLSFFVADLSITARSSHVSRWREPLLKQTGLIVVPDTLWRQNSNSHIPFPTDCFLPIPESPVLLAVHWITGHINSLVHNLVCDVNNSTCEATAIEGNCKWSEISTPAITVASNPLRRIKYISLASLLLAPGTETSPIPLI